MEHQFKIGDRVRVIGHRPTDLVGLPPWNSEMDKTCGKKGFIAGFLPHSICVRLENGGMWCYKPSWLKPLQAWQESLLKVGDYIKVLRDKGFFPVGTTLIIERVDSNNLGLPYRAGGWWFGKDDVELVTPSCFEPMRISTPYIYAKKGFWGASNPKEPTSKLPLINKTKLLTTIKLD